jgi:predicted negative regulator of RcsB-dependent stress response
MAIDDLLDEHEQGERVRGWLRDNGAGLIGGVALGLALIWGGQWWQQQRQHQRMQAGVQFQSAVDNLKAGKLAQAQPQVAALPDGTYATLAAMALAKAQLAAGKRDDAIATLRAAKAKDAEMAAIIDQRLARLLIDAGKAKDALAMLPADSRDPETLQIRGDAYSALGQQPQAQAAYAQALTGLDVGSPQRNVVELKLSEVGGMPAKPEARS